MPPATRRPCARLAAADVDVDAFLEGAFEDVDTATPSRRPPPSKRGRSDGGGTRKSGGCNAAPAPPSSDDDSGYDAPVATRKKAKAVSGGAKGTPAGRGTRTTSAAASHRAELAALASKDPDFYAYLQAADADLLQFDGWEGGDDDDDDASLSDASSDGAIEDAPAPRRLAAPVSPLSSDDDADEAGVPAAAPQPATPPGRTPTTAARPPPPPALLAQWCAEAKATPSLRTVRRLLQAYRAAAHHGDPTAGDDDDGGADGAAAALARAPASAFNALVVSVLTHGDGMLRSLLGQPKTLTDVGERRPDPRCAARWRKVEPLARAYLGNTLHMLTSLADPSMTAFILRRLRPSVDLLVCSERLAKKTLKGALAAYGGADARAAVAGALFVRAYARALPGDGPLDAALKGAYREFVKSAKFMTAATAPRLALQAAALVDLYGGAPPAAAYRHAFSYVRQLAGLVRGAVAGKAKDGHRAVYCWQTVTCLELWARVVGDLAPERVPSLAPLAFPVLTLLSSAAALVPTPRYHPLHLRLHRAAHGLASATGAYVPLTAPLLDMLAWKGLTTPPKRGSGGVSARSNGSVLDAMLLRASKADLASPAFQQALVDDVLELTASHLAQWAGSPAFPELSRPAAVRLRAFVKAVRVDRFRVAAKGLLAAIDATAADVAAARADGVTAPCDGAAVAAFTAARSDRAATPLGRHADALAASARERRELAAAAAVKYGDGDSRRDRRTGKQAESDDDASDDNGAPPPSHDAPRCRKAPPAPVSAAAGWTDDVDAGDVLMPYVESDSD